MTTYTFTTNELVLLREALVDLACRLAPPRDPTAARVRNYNTTLLLLDRIKQDLRSRP